MRSHDLLNSARGQLYAMLLLALVVLAAFWIGEGLAAALPPFLLLLVFAVLITLGRSRSATVEVMSGIGDERTTALYTRAGALTSSVLSFVFPVWWLATVARGDVNETLSFVCAIYGVTFVLASLVVARRG